MLSSDVYIDRIMQYFKFLFDELKFDIINKEIVERFYYDIQMRKDNLIVSFSYEVFEEYFLVTLRQQNSLGVTVSSYLLTDVTKHTFNTLNEDQILDNANNFSSMEARDKLSRTMLKNAKELRLYLKFMLDI